MSNNFKEQAAYDYLHDNDRESIDPKYLRSVKNKWKRHNNEYKEVRRMIERRNKKQFNRDLNAELEKYYDEK